MLRILLIKRGALGDLLLATPLIRQLKSKLDCRVDLVVGAAAAAAVANNPYLDQQFILADQDFQLTGVLRLTKFLLSLRGNYDYVFILDKHCYFNLFGRLVAPKVVGYYREWFSKLILTQAVSYDTVKRYHADYYLDLLQSSGLALADYASIALDLVILAVEKEQVRRFLAIHEIDEFVVVVNSGGNNCYEASGIRMLPMKKILQLLAGLLEQGKIILLLGGKLDSQNYEEYFKQLNQPKLLYNLAGKLSVGESAYLLSQAEMFYTTDCGAMHFGVAMDLQQRMQAFFGPTNPQHILPPKYLSSSAFWFDEEIYDPQYQLVGKLRAHEPDYFSCFNFALNSASELHYY